MDHPHSDSRPPPPAYNRVVNKVTRGRNLRPVILVCTLLIFIWCLIVAVANLKSTFHDISGKLMAAYIIQASLYLSLCILSIIVFWAAWTSKIKAGKVGVISVYIGTLILVAAHVCHIALHFAFKSDIKSHCEVEEREDYPGASTAEITDWCDSDWRNDIWRQIAWAIFCFICAGLMILFSRSFYHQILDPNHGRTQSTGYAASHAYRMGDLNNQGPPPHMPYGGPPPSSTHMQLLSNPFASAPEYNAPPMYVAPEKGSPYENFTSPGSNDRKDSMVDVRMEDASNMPHDRDLAAQTEGLTSARRSNDSDDTIQGRRGEGRI